MTITIRPHPDKEVQAAIVRLADALCSWERETGRQSILILREVGGFCFRAASGKPEIPDDISDSMVLAQLPRIEMKPEELEEVRKAKENLIEIMKAHREVQARGQP